MFKYSFNTFCILYFLGCFHGNRIYTEKPAQTWQVHQTQTCNCTKYLKQITMRCRIITTYLKKINNNLRYLSKRLVSLSFLVTLLPE